MTIPHSERARQIADKLSSPMRQAILGAKNCYAGEWVIGASVNGLTIRSLISRGLAGNLPVLQVIGLTPLGLSVRQILQESPPQ